MKALSRELKFRAWNDYTERLYKWEDLENAGSTNYIHEYFSNIKENGYHLMQFTGLLDNQNKEIYEGDLIKGVLRFPASEAFREVKGRIEWTVDSNECKFRVCESKKVKDYREDEEYFGMQQFGDIEIIGNIYENPNLLTP